MGDRKMTFMPWEEENVDGLDPITRPSSMSLTVGVMSGRIPKFFARKDTGRRTENLQARIGYSASMKDVKQRMFRWTQEK